jgi:hypothetical protein
MESNIRHLYEVRDVTTDDTNFILATFLRGLYYGNEFYKLIPKQIFMEGYKPVIEGFFSRTTIKVACLKEDPTVILGFSILSKDFKTIHWVYVKQAWREQGIANSLTPPDLEAYSHFTTLGLSLAQKFPKLIFNPFKL